MDLCVGTCAGMICTRCSPLQVANDAIFDARSICMREYATAPEVSLMFISLAVGKWIRVTAFVWLHKRDP